MLKAFPGEALGARGEVEGLKRNPSAVAAARERFKDRSEVVVAGAAMAAVELVDVDVPDEIEVAVHEGIVRFGLVDGVVHVEHGTNGGAGDFIYDGHCLRQGLYHVRLICG